MAGNKFSFRDAIIGVFKGRTSFIACFCACLLKKAFGLTKGSNQGQSAATKLAQHAVRYLSTCHVGELTFPRFLWSAY